MLTRQHFRGCSTGSVVEVEPGLDVLPEMPECLEVNGVATTSPDCHCHAIRADVGVKGTERPSLCCSNANISQSLSIDIR